jgi:hypothetical protein
MSEGQRRYSDEEFTRILSVALRLQEERKPRRVYGDGLTLVEMEAAARDVGIDPVLVRRAAALVAERATPRDRLLGGPTRYRLSRSTSGKASPDEMARVVDMIREELGAHGRVSSELDGVTWESEGDLSRIHVTLRPTGDRTDVRVSVNRDAAFITTWFLSVTAGIVSASVTGAVLDPATVAGGAVILGTGVAGGLTLARGLWALSTRTVRTRAEALMDLIQRGLGG